MLGLLEEWVGRADQQLGREQVQVGGGKGTVSRTYMAVWWCWWLCGGAGGGGGGWGLGFQEGWVGRADQQLGREQVGVQVGGACLAVLAMQLCIYSCVFF